MQLAVMAVMRMGRVVQVVLELDLGPAEARMVASMRMSSKLH